MLRAGPWRWESPPWPETHGYALRDAEGRRLARVAYLCNRWEIRGDRPVERLAELPSNPDWSAEAAMHAVSEWLRTEGWMVDATIFHPPKGTGDAAIVPVTLAPGRAVRIDGRKVQLLSLVWVPALKRSEDLRALVHHPKLHREGEVGLAYGDSEELRFDWPLSLYLTTSARLDVLAFLIREARWPAAP